MRRQPQSITHGTQLLVEGKDSEGFFEAMTRHLNLRDVQIQDFGGVSELQRFLHAFVKVSGFSQIANIGIVRDAEECASAAFESVQGALKRTGLSVPCSPRKRVGIHPRVSVMVLPDDSRAGMLETLLWETVPDDVQCCIDSFVSCVEEVRGGAMRNPHKARAGAYLSTQNKPNLSVGVAAKRTFWDLDHDALDSVREFLRNLSSVA